MTQTPMIERMARAMCAADGQIWEYTVDESDKNGPLYNGCLRDMYIAHAKAVLRVIADPTDEMVRNARIEYGGMRLISDSDFVAIYGLMIQTAGGGE
jgi:hypothetical protein